MLKVVNDLSLQIDETYEMYNLMGVLTLTLKYIVNAD